MKRFFTIIIILLVQINLFAQTPKNLSDLSKEEIMELSYDDLLDLSFEDLLLLSSKLGVSIDDLLKMKTSVASKTALNPRETPGIISIITDEEIKASGARDLTDVLQLVPGISFTYDAQGIIGIQMRGNWGFEGKVLFLIDGMELNELQYNVYPLLNHIQLDNIKRIEIIRGPGSAIYGGSAELGVVNIISKNGSELKGAYINANSGFTEKINSKNALNLSVGNKNGDFQYAINGNLSQSHMSDGKLIDEYGELNMADTLLPMKSYNFNIAASYKQLKTNFFYDYYRSDYGDYATSDAIYTSEFKTVLCNINYDYKINDKIHLLPKFNFKHSKPYYDDTYPYCINVNRFSPGLQLQYDINQKINLLAGFDYYYDDYNMNKSSDIKYYGDEPNNKNIALFAQSLIKSDFANITVGARFENNSEFGNAIAPRLAITKIVDNFHIKLLGSGAFRSPAVGNTVNTACDSTWDYAFYNFTRNNVKPEKTWVVEMEAGYKLNKNMFITANIYDITINNTIVWFENDYDWGYTNQSRTGTRGFELEYRAKYKKFYLNTSYAYYSAKDKNKVDYFATDSTGNKLLGSPQNKLALSAGYNFSEQLSWNVAYIYQSKEYAKYYTITDEVFNPAIVKFNPKNLLNTYLSYHQKHFEIGFGINNVLNSKSNYTQPYKGVALPVPMLSREYFIKVGFNISR